MVTKSKMTSEILYEKLLDFAKRCQELVSKLPKTAYNLVYGKQLIRSSSSPGSNYIEAIEASSRKDFVYRLKVCRKETKESIHWIRLILYANKEIKEIKNECDELINNGREFIRIFSSSILTAEKNQKMKK